MVFPAPAGVVPTSSWLTRPSGRIPRACGVAPRWITQSGFSLRIPRVSGGVPLYSPRLRGWSPLLHPVAAGRHVVPA